MDLAALLRRRVERHPRLRRFLADRREDLAAIRTTMAAAAPWTLVPHTKSITVAVTAKCNLACHGCRYGRDFMVGEELSWPILETLIDDAASLGVDVIRLYGGEPMLYAELPRAVRHAIARGVQPYVTTNAVLLGRRIDELHDAGLRFLTIGFYGTGDAHASYTQRPGAFEAIERSVAAVRERHPDVRLRINWLLMRPSCTPQAVAEVCAFAERYSTPIQVDLVHYSLPYFTEGPDRCLQFRPEDRAAIDRVVDDLVARKRARPELIEQSEEGLRSIPDWLLLGPAMRVPCDAHEMVWVGADGSVQLCYVTFPLGNLHEMRLREMLGTPRHTAAARCALRVECPNCHCGYDRRVRRHLPTRSRYGTSRPAPPSASP